ncbi:MAG: phosphatidylserine decarboxylase [Gammaproteobacteria bacterium]|nr:phosphatidylserine decarboxylase [Gammaproteobacteria bacterium]
MGQRAFLWLQHLLPKTLLTRLAGAFARRRIPLLTPWVMQRFIQAYGVNMAEAAQPDPSAYATFNAFFTRALRSGARPLAPPPALLCPCDGAVSEAGDLDGDRLLQAKGVTYTAAELLGDAELAESFRGGSFATLYLAPRDYHRVHMPADGILESMAYLPGGLFSVNPATAAARAGLFARNERVVATFQGAGDRFAMVLVGAMIVGGIRTAWAGRVTPRSAEPWRLALETRRFCPRGSEMGTFELGSTVILLFPPGRARLDKTLTPGHKVRMGEAIGEVFEPDEPVR